MPSGTMAGTPRTPAPGPRARGTWTGKRVAAFVAAMVVALVLAGWAGYGIYAATHPAGSVTVATTFHGKITIVGNNGTSGCVRSDTGGQRVCSVFFTVPGTHLHNGEEVNAAEQWVHHGNGGYNLLLIYPDHLT